jgi:hypothetical protein
MNISYKNWLYNGESPLICIGVNPSTAEPENLDNTMKSVERLAQCNGFDSWIMLNLYTQRATNPMHLHPEADHNLHMENLAHIEKLLSSKPISTIWAAWGTLIECRPYFFSVSKISML